MSTHPPETPIIQLKVKKKIGKASSLSLTILLQIWLLAM